MAHEGVARMVTQGKEGRGTAVAHRVRRWRASTMVLAILLAIFGSLAFTGTAAQAAPPPSDDRLGDQPSGWWMYNNVDATTLSDKLTENQARLTDLRVNSASPLTFTATMVPASGPYGTGYWWYFDRTRAQVDSLLAANNARPISLQKYWTGSAWRFAVVMVPNTGADYRPFTIAEGSASAVSSAVTAFGDGRLAGLSVDVGDSTFSNYTAIIVSNANGYGWWWYPSLTADGVGSVLKTTGGRLVDLDPHGNGTFSVLIYAMPGQYWWYYDQTPKQMLDLAGQHGARVIDLTPYRSGGTVRYAGIMVNNLTGLSAQLRDEFDGNTFGGSFGFRLQQVGGPVIAGLQTDKQFEPASSIKALYHLHTLIARQGGMGDTTTLAYRTNDFSQINSPEAGICPGNALYVNATDLKTAEEQMMWNSDNRMTKAITDRFGYPAIGNTGTKIGMTRTVLQHDDGCPTATTHNYTTLDDLAKVYEAGFTRTGTDQVLNSTHRGLFHTRMLNEFNTKMYGTAANPDDGICDVVGQEAGKLGKSSQAGEFCLNIVYMTKGGSYDYGAGVEAGLGTRSAGHLLGLPAKSGGVINRTFYTYGDFVDNFTDTASTSASIGSLRGQAFLDAIRPLINQALQTW